MYAVFVLHKLNSRHVWHKNLSIDFYAEILLIFVTMYTVLRRSSFIFVQWKVYSYVPNF